MELCRNIETGLFFVFLADDSPEKVLLITPWGDVKPLKRSFFTDPVVADAAESLLAEGKINRKQYAVYRKYSKRAEQ